MKKFRVVIRAFTLRRDIASAMLLKTLLERRGCEVILASSRNFRRSVYYWKPHAILVNTVGQVRRCAELSPSSAIIMWPGEGANAPKHGDPVNFSNRPEDYNLLSKYLSWGVATHAHFDKVLSGSDPKTRAICGNPRLDLVKFHPELLKHRNSTRTIGFIGKYHIFNRYNAIPAIFSMQSPDKLPRVAWQMHNFFGMIEIILRLIRETDYQINIRPHPLEAPEGYNFMEESEFSGRVTIDNSLDMAQWIARQDIIVAPSSTSFYESYLLRVPTINLDTLTGNTRLAQEMTPHASLSQLVSYNPSTADEALEMIRSDLPPTPPNTIIDEHLQQFHDWSSPKSALVRAADETLAVMHKRDSKLWARLPLATLQLWDLLSLQRAVRKDSLHTNFNYHPRYHPKPKHFAAILHNIDNLKIIPA